MNIIPQHGMSHWVGRLVHKQMPEPFSQISVQYFAKAYNINMSEAEHPIESYKTIGELFTRHLKMGARPVGFEPVHPCDSEVLAAGPIAKDQLIQAKGKNYTLTQLLRVPQLAQQFENGHFVTYYLCPTDYHRVHSPISGVIKECIHIPGELWPVNLWSVNQVDNLYGRNERVVIAIESDLGRAVVVMVAATNVGNMKMLFDNQIATHQRGPNRSMREKSYGDGIAIQHGQELGVFCMGSTVVMLMDQKLASHVELPKSQSRVKVGQSFKAN